jgi:hypothetical protein
MQLIKQYIIGGDTNAIAKAARLEAAQRWTDEWVITCDEAMTAGARQAHVAQLGDARAMIGEKCSAHGFHPSKYTFLAACERAEATMAKAGLHLRERVGAMLKVESGAPVAKSYKYTRRGQLATLVRGAKDWRLVSIERCELSPHEGGTERVHLMQAQRDTVASVAVGKFGRVATTGA